MRKAWSTIAFAVACFRSHWWSSRKIMLMPVAAAFGTALGETMNKTVLYWKEDFRALTWGTPCNCPHCALFRLYGWPEYQLIARQHLSPK